MVPKKKSSKRTASTKKRVPKVKATRPVKITKGPGAIHITYGDPKHVLPHLLDLASDFAKKHFADAVYTSAADDVLGTDAAREIVSNCAKSNCWSCTLADLHLDSQLFQECVFSGIENRGYHKDRNEIPASQDTQLYTVVMAIQDAPRKDS